MIKIVKNLIFCLVKSVILKSWISAFLRLFGPNFNFQAKKEFYLKILRVLSTLITNIVVSENANSIGENNWHKLLINSQHALNYMPT